MNLEELQNKLIEIFDGDYSNEDKVNINNFILYTQEIKKQEPIVNIMDILDNSKNEGKIYIDYDKEYDAIYFSEFSTNDFLGIDIKFLAPFSNISSQKNPYLGIQIDNFDDEEQFLNAEWPNFYILFDEKMFNQFINPPNKPEFLNWKSNPWKVK